MAPAAEAAKKAAAEKKAAAAAKKKAAAEAERKKAEAAARAAAAKKKKAEAAAAAAAAAAASTRAAKKKSGAPISGGLTKPQLEKASREVLFAFCEAAVRGHGDKLAGGDKITNLSDKAMTKDTLSSLLLDAHTLGEYEGAPDPNDFPPAKKPAVDSQQSGTSSSSTAAVAVPPTTGDAATTATSTVSQMLTSMAGAGGGVAFANAVASARTNGDLLKAQLFLEQTLGQFFEFERNAAGTFQVSLTARGRETFRGVTAPALSGVHHKVLDDLSQALSFYKTSELFREEATAVNAQLHAVLSDHSKDTIVVHENPSQLALRTWVGYAMTITMSVARHESHYVYTKMDELIQQVTLLYTSLRTLGTMNPTTLRRIGQLSENMEEEHYADSLPLSAIVGGVKKHRTEAPADPTPQADGTYPKNWRSKWCRICRKHGHASESCRKQPAREKGGADVKDAKDGKTRK